VGVKQIDTHGRKLPYVSGSNSKYKSNSSDFDINSKTVFSISYFPPECPLVPSALALLRFGLCIARVPCYVWSLFDKVLVCCILPSTK